MEAVRYLALSKKISVILGDLNEEYFDNEPITQGLAELNFAQLVKHSTDVRGGLIGHVYLLFGYSTFAKTKIYIRSVYYSDHDAIQMDCSFVRESFLY